MRFRNAVALLVALMVAMDVGISAAEYSDSDSDDIERFCYPEEHKNSRQSCECSNESAPPWGMRALKIDCSYKDLKTSAFSEELPLYVTTMDLSWNAMQLLPTFRSDSLRSLSLMHNNISTVASKNFVKVSNLRELYLAWNSIQSIEANAFDDLAHLLVLDLSHNNLHALHFHVFSPMLILDTLSLSWNRQLNKSEGIQELDLYQTLGITPNLRALKMEACSLANVVLPERAHLAELCMRRNRLIRMPEKLPAALQILDISANPFETLRPNDTVHLTQLHEFYVEDMPQLTTVEENALVPLQALQKLSLQNSRQLAAFDAYAFGANATAWPPLKSLILRGTSLATFNATLLPVFANLTELDLNGTPLRCDCHLMWVRQLNFETNGRCFKPSKLRGLRLSKARDSELKCDSWPHWVYGLIIVGLIAMSSVGIYLIVMGLRPHRGVTMRHKVGSGSPYARVTIEPNRQENNYY